MTRCPECKGKCCLNTDYGYRVYHMGAEIYIHQCDYCYDGEVPKTDPRDAAVNAAPHLLAEVDALRAQLEALASLIKRWPTCPHWQDCATLNRGGDCTCGAVEADLARAEARRLLEVEDA